ncbi:DUF4359 domain-containing protein [Polynucleobacter sp. MWH-Spelu-300-X4]|uniref:DUF4359 domain-containing protein n=1 Tax=Polynucleobacter sp. MWH-Spelu-300-X4 TaxID=2689109 RepID=UPI001BFE2291|nr:DUF4359 domain-containing protein [Polynucleobacter sp. MWH-Spelu-300-X4]QWD80523.1 DUF4359 domain-containing protein [Polynucleobacter sp. MWH-Spelu-300-X4]
MSDQQPYQAVAKKENNHFLIGVIAVIAVALYATNPTKQEFNEFIAKQVRQKLAEKSGEQNFITNLVAGVAGAMVNDASERKDYLIFSTYKVDLSVVRMFGGEYKDLQFLGVGGQFIPLSGMSLDSGASADGRSIPAPAPLPIAPQQASQVTYNSIYYVTRNTKEFGWAKGYVTQEAADAAAYNSCLKQNQGECKKLIGGAYRCLAIYSNSNNIFAYIDNNLDTAKQNAYAHCSRESAPGDSCAIPQYGTACAN